MSSNVESSANFTSDADIPILDDYQRVLYSFVGRKFFGKVATVEEVEDLLQGFQRRIEN